MPLTRKFVPKVRPHVALPNFSTWPHAKLLSITSGTGLSFYRCRILAFFRVSRRFLLSIAPSGSSPLMQNFGMRAFGLSERASVSCIGISVLCGV